MAALNFIPLMALIVIMFTSKQSLPILLQLLLNGTANFGTVTFGTSFISNATLASFQKAPPLDHLQCIYKFKYFHIFRYIFHGVAIMYIS